jgi:hypothetical protein
VTDERVPTGPEADSFDSAAAEQDGGQPTSPASPVSGFGLGDWLKWAAETQLLSTVGDNW